MNWQHAAAVFVGGGAGAVCRYLLGAAVGHWAGTQFPWSTLFVNLVGCLVMGVVVGLFAVAWSPGPWLRAFLTVGLLGGFTTFSAFAADALLLSDRGLTLSAAAYAAGSVLGCLFLAWTGMRLARMVF